MELILPKSWFKTIHTAGDNLFRRNRKDRKMHSYDLNHKESGALEYIRKMQQMTQNQLITRILQLEEDK